MIGQEETKGKSMNVTESVLHDKKIRKYIRTNNKTTLS